MKCTLDFHILFEVLHKVCGDVLLGLDIGYVKIVETWGINQVHICARDSVQNDVCSACVFVQFGLVPVYHVDVQGLMISTTSTSKPVAYFMKVDLPTPATPIMATIWGAISAFDGVPVQRCYLGKLTCV